MPDIIEEIEEEVSEIFVPKPGGLVDRHRKEKARREAAQKEREQADERVEETSYKAIKTTQLSPEVVACVTITIPAGGTSMVLPNSPYRYRATLIASATVVLGKDAGQALGQAGFTLPANVPFPVFTRSQLWAYSTAAATVSVLAELYAPEK
jgi:hypothetical protein